MSGEVIARKFLVSGRVQGVNYRWFAQRAAEALGLRGYVRNLPDGRVEALAEGPPPLVDSLRRELERGPRLSLVTDIEEQEVEPSNSFTGFSSDYSKP